MAKKSKSRATDPVDTPASSRTRSIDPEVGPLAARPLPEVAEALRSRCDLLLQEWIEQVRRAVPSMAAASDEDVKDHLPDILRDMAEALASGKPREIKQLMERSPAQGIHRYQLRYGIRELATEDRILRLMILEHVEAGLGRRMSEEEGTGLNWVVDLMLQQAVTAFVDYQSARLRDAAEAELKFLSFLSHDLSGNLGSITVWLQVLKRRLSATPQFASELTALDEAQQAILDTMGGMGRLLQAERLRHRGVAPKLTRVNLHDLAAGIAAQFRRQAQDKGLELEVIVPRDATATSDAELIRLVLQNLVGNAVKYSTRGTIRIDGEPQGGRVNPGWTISVSDQGPGIGPEHLESIFEAFRRGEMHGQAGIGLGLAIASRAAKLLHGELSIESKMGQGSAFRLSLPAEPGGDGDGSPRHKRVRL